MPKAGRQLRTHHQIRQAFLGMLSEMELKKITIKELAARADIDRKTFYLHYDSITQVVEEIQAEILEEVSMLLSEFDLSSPSFDTVGFFHKLNSYVEEQASTYRALINADRYNFLSRKLQKELRDTMIETYHFKNGNDTVPNQIPLYAEYVTAGIMAMYVNWLISPGNVTLNELGEIASEVTFSGCRKILTGT